MRILQHHFRSMSLSETGRKRRAAGLPVLDLVAGPIAAAYSLRRLSVTYGGAAITVRRAYDNATADIGFDYMGNLDIQTLSQFVNNSTGTVYRWFDQSGNGRHITQDIYSRQPAVMIAGVLVQKNGLPALSFDGFAAQYLTRNSAFMYDAGAASICAVVSQLPETNRWLVAEGNLYTISPIYAPVICDSITGATLARYQRSNAGGAPNLYTSPAGTIAAFNDELNTITAIDTGTTFTHYVNGQYSNEVAYTRAGACTLNTFTIGGIVQTITRLYYNGLLSEILLYPRTITAAEQATIQQSQQQYYLTPFPNID